MTREEIVKAIRKCHRKLGRVPTREQLSRMAGVNPTLIYHRFDSYTEAVRLAGLEPRGGPYRVNSELLLLDWAAVARKIGKLPTKAEYTKHGRFSTTPFEWRWISWPGVVEAFKAYVADKALQKDWGDVLEMIEARRPGIIRWKAEPDSGQPAGRPEALLVVPAPRPRQATVARVAPSRACLPRLQPLPGRPIYGDPIFVPGMAREPVNEAGVVFLFGMMAHRLGFAVEHLQPSFPDCQAMRQIEPGRWQRVGIEFEYESRNFERHGHEIDGCDLIVCWIHNWTECPPGLEVIELRRAVVSI